MKQRKLVDSFEEYLKQESNKNPINKKIKGILDLHESIRDVLKEANVMST
jgi:hypothetical protein